MNLFDRLVDQALLHQNGLASLRVVVEKELLHHDILREMSNAGFLSQLTFIGGTCLRLCYGSHRLSEDLDFSASENFDFKNLSRLPDLLENRLQEKYGLTVVVSKPLQDKEEGNVSTWQVKVQTRPARPDLKAQRINIDVCTIPSHAPKPMMLRNFYGIEMGTSGLILNAESLEEILADKLMAFVLRPNQMKYRDLWDIVWLHQQGVVLSLEFIKLKIQDRALSEGDFFLLLDKRQNQLKESSIEKEFQFEMTRFLPIDISRQTVSRPEYWVYLKTLMHELCMQIKTLKH
jgi:predicted nucleotidyltransferase component of viral defense system